MFPPPTVLRSVPSRNAAQLQRFNFEMCLTLPPLKPPDRRHSQQPCVPRKINLEQRDIRDEVRVIRSHRSDGGD